ncbi:plasmid replication initiator RepA [Methylococcaceae bacterium CS1]|nr:plasmid replication initiator RepA [Methylococcaceae bacterium CS4]TXK93135.1 plasmid replication initiator RepA [Methylococcaceae bacterium CS5]TXL02616.1 plasmid replication initiator RepA [Methylococcaceae bacterium CS3]TXL03124.1 plasmid replication initiator RepA [Methylococcaceae bacterium CS1]TXL03190.1 plasmid replication initiator RepA [Methylococcaceae bacterium CS2]
MADLFPDRHKQQDFFTCDIFDSFRDDLASMEHPVFSLSKKPDHRMLEYERNGVSIKIKPSYTGLATIFDKDILMYLVSALMNAKNSGEAISQTVRFTSYDYIVSTNKSLGGAQYRLLKDALARLKGTTIETNLKTNGTEMASEFGLIDQWRVVKEDKKGSAIAIEVKLSDWFYNSVLGDSVLTIDRSYFRLRKPTDRRLYELARKHCGNQPVWKIKLENLKIKLGTTTPLRKLRFNISKLAESNHLPEYNISIQDDIVMFNRKAPPKEFSEQLPKHVSAKEIVAAARPGESTKEVKARLSKLKLKLGRK